MIDSESYVELNGRERAKYLLDEEVYEELLGPFDGFESPHLEMQGIVPQSDDGVIIARGTMDGKKTLVISMEGDFQGGGIGEVSGAKIAGSLELALKECEKGNLIFPIIIFDTGGVRLQEANYGLLAIAEIHAAIVALRKYVPVIALIPGKVGAYGGMSITVGLCSSIIMTKEGRLSLNGPGVIEQEAGIQEFDSHDRILIWQTSGGEQRVKSGFADVLVEDDIEKIKNAVKKSMSQKIEKARPEQIETYLNMLHMFNPKERLTPSFAEELLTMKNESTFFFEKPVRKKKTEYKVQGRGIRWFHELTADANNISNLSTVRVADKSGARFIAVVPDEQNPFQRVQNGEVGLLEGWTIAKYVWEVIEDDSDKEVKRPIILIVDVPSQAYGYNEELLGIHQSLAAAVNAYAKARLAGHPIIAFIPGFAISGAFLAHGMQANRIIALRDEEVNVHVMSRASAALITQRTIEELDEVTKDVPAMAYDIDSFSTLGALYELVEGVNADTPEKKDVEIARTILMQAIEDVRSSEIADLTARLTSEIARKVVALHPLKYVKSCQSNGNRRS